MRIRDLPFVVMSVLLYVVACWLCIVHGQPIDTERQDLLFFPYGLLEGDLELPLLDDTGIEIEELSISSFPFFDQNHLSLYVNTNGVISFLQNVEQYTPDSFPLGNNRRIVAPFWADVDITNGGHVWYRQSHDPALLRLATDEVARVFTVEFKFNRFRAQWLLIATWDKVAFYSSRGQAGQIGNKENTFQAVLITDGTYSFTIFNYGEIQWTTGASSYGNKLTGLAGDSELAVPAQVGFNAGDGTNFYSVPNSQTDEILQINRTTNVRKPGRWMFRIDGREIEVAGCENDLDGTLRISPSQVNMLGGDVLSISGPCFDASSDIFCRIEGYVIQGSYDLTEDPFTVRCATPLFMSLGEAPVFLSKDSGRNYNYTGFITVVGMARVAPRVVPTTANDVLTVSWEADGYPFTNSLDEDTVRVDVYLYSYTEDTRTGEIQLAPVQTIVEDVKLINGFYSVIHVTPDAQIDVGIYRVVGHGTVDISQPGISITMGIPGTAPSQAPIPAMWSLPFNANPDDDQDAASRWCQSWASTEATLADVAMDNNLAECPCLLEQARVDVGAFEPDPWCDEASLNGNKCPYRMNVVHCVRARRGSDRGRGQLCCYDDTSNIVLLEDSYEGGSVQSHFHGGHSPPGLPGNVPYLSHYLGDRIPWEQCCPRTGSNQFSCNLYRERRPSNDCKNYLLPKPASVFGEPHFITFDGVKYTFNGYGEFTLVSTSPREGVVIQGRLAQIMDNVAATGLTAVTMKVGGSDTVQVEISDRRTLDVWVRSEERGTWRRLGFEQSSWWITRPKGSIVELIGDMESQGIRVIFDQGTSFEAKAPSGASAMALKILAAPALKDDTQGLLGEWNENADDDLQTPNGAIFSGGSMEVLHNFVGLKWLIDPDDSRFRYDISMNRSLVNQPKFVASYTFDSALTEEELSNVCGDSQVCRYDYQKTGSAEMGIGASDAERDDEQTRDTKPITSCGYLRPPVDGSKMGEVYLLNHTVTFSCLEGYELTGSVSRQCIDGVWQGNITSCIKPEYMISDLFLIIIIAAALAALLLILFCLLCLICLFRRRKKKTQKKKHAEHELGVMSIGGGIPNEALVTTPLPVERTPSDTPNTSITELDPPYEHSLQRRNHHDAHPQQAGSVFPYPEVNRATSPGYVHMRRSTASDRAVMVDPEDGLEYQASAIASHGPGYRSAEEAAAGPSRAGGSSTGSSRPIPGEPPLSKSPKIRARENTYDDPRMAKLMMESGKNRSTAKDRRAASHYDLDDDSSEDDIGEIKRQLKREIEEEDRVV